MILKKIFIKIIFYLEIGNSNYDCKECSDHQQFLSKESHLIRKIFCFFCILSSFSIFYSMGEDVPFYPQTGIGFSYSSCQFEVLAPIIDESINKENPLYQRICADRAHIERMNGIYGWGTLDFEIDVLSKAGYRIILNLLDSSIDKSILKTTQEEELKRYAKGWLAFLKKTAKRYKDRVKYFEIWNSPDMLFDDEDLMKKYAYLLKNSSIKLKSESPDVAIIAGCISIKNAEWLEKFYMNDVSTYFDALIVRYKFGDDIDPFYESIQKTVLEHDPSAKIWLMEEWIGTIPVASKILRSIVNARERDSGLILFSSNQLQTLGEREKKSILTYHQLFSPFYSRSYEEAKSVEFFSMNGEKLPVSYSKYFDPETFKTIIAFYPADDSGELPDTVRMKIGKGELKVAALYDIEEEISGKLYKFDHVVKEGDKEVKKEMAETDLPLKNYPVFIQYREAIATPGFEDEIEQIGVTGKKEMSAEEIIARHQEFQDIQDDMLRNYIASGKIDFHFKMGGASGTVDVTTNSNFYWERGAGVEWEHKEYFINGNRLRWKKIPELPLIQPEKVVVLPLDIHLDKSYQYRYLKKDRVGDRECYLLEFSPVHDFKKMYKGKVWIDQKTFAIAKLYTVQTDLEAPILTNEERNFYEPVRGTNGFDHWLLHRMEGQQIFSAGGRNFIVLREVAFSDFDINGDDFKEKQKVAYRSDHQILKDTDKGFRYFSKNEKGERFIKEDIDTSQVFAIGGIYKDNSFDNVVPLAGINFFDYEFLGKGVQMNLFFAGILATLNITDADFLNSRFDFGLDFVGLALKREDKFFERGTEIEEKNAKYLSQYLGINLGYPVGDFFKVRGTFSLDYTSYSPSDETLLSFVIPSDNLTYGTGILGEYNQSGYGIETGIRYQKRSKWEPWGLKDTDTGEFLEYSPEHKDFVRYFASASKEFFLPFFQKLRFEGEWMSGSDLDRFSKYRIGYFVTRVRGFGGSGIRYDRGSIARGQYSFNLFKIIRFDALVDYARVRDRYAFDQDINLTGVGLSANFVGPWRTIIALDYGYALHCDIEEIEGSNEFLFVVFKLF